ncbi:MmcQ/YjbR family DNA-binding protein [Shimia aestuarii]|uniref:MmcQ/YjbR family DNA-binding protein n=1 Tax=Shimia aestuarii TaxID=254406 RepID=UPI003D719ED9
MTQASLHLTLRAMSRDTVNTICAALPGADWSEPFGPGHDVWKVGDKIFAAIGAQGTGVSVKTPDVETAQMLIDAGVGVKAPYFHKSWIHLPLDAETEELRHRITASYDLIRASLTKKAQAALAPRA